MKLNNWLVVSNPLTSGFDTDRELMNELEAMLAILK
jgi:hypothetical protein